MNDILHQSVGTLLRGGLWVQLSTKSDFFLMWDFLGEFQGSEGKDQAWLRRRRNSTPSLLSVEPLFIEAVRKECNGAVSEGVKGLPIPSGLCQRKMAFSKEGVSCDKEEFQRKGYQKREIKKKGRSQGRGKYDFNQLPMKTHVAIRVSIPDWPITSISMVVHDLMMEWGLCTPWSFLMGFVNSLRSLLSTFVFKRTHYCRRVECLFLLLHSIYS